MRDRKVERNRKAVRNRKKYVIARNFPSGDDRRIGDQIIRTVVSRGILPFQHGDRRSVVHTETALRLERQRGLLVSPRQVKLMDVSSSVVYENVPVERVELVAELRERVQRLDHRTLEILVDFRGGIVWRLMSRPLFVLRNSSMSFLPASAPT